MYRKRSTPNTPPPTHTHTHIHASLPFPILVQCCNDRQKYSQFLHSLKNIHFSETPPPKKKKKMNETKKNQIFGPRNGRFTYTCMSNIGENQTPSQLLIRTGIYQDITAAQYGYADMNQPGITQ